jgi:predicted Zn-ribbon and HTH transcriptional regulator
MNLKDLLVKCGRCGHEWQKRIEKPVHCPKCKSPYWNKPRVREKKVVSDGR